MPRTFPDPISSYKNVILAVLLFAITGFAADSESWPQFRGPASNPIASNPQLADRWSITENVEWSTPIPGRGWSSPIVTNGNGFVTTGVTEGASEKRATRATSTGH